MGQSKSSIAIVEGENNDIIQKYTEKYGEFDQVFEKFDINEDQTLGDSEIVSAINHYSQIRSGFKNQLTELLNEVELINPVNKEDFREVMSAYTGKNKNEEDMIQVFKGFDKNLCGYIGKEEICHVFGKIGLNLNNEQGQKLVEEADKDGDGKVDFEEFIKILISK